MRKVQSKEVDAKKEYLAALSLPGKEVVEAMGGDRTMATNKSEYLQRKNESNETLNSYLKLKKL